LQAFDENGYRSHVDAVVFPACPSVIALVPKTITDVEVNRALPQSSAEQNSRADIGCGLSLSQRRPQQTSARRRRDRIDDNVRIDDALGWRTPVAASPHQLWLELVLIAWLTFGPPRS
jgi:hypothetical protein